MAALSRIRVPYGFTQYYSAKKCTIGKICTKITRTNRKDYTK
jgi:hypothetical protein